MLSATSSAGPVRRGLLCLVIAMSVSHLSAAEPELPGVDQLPARPELPDPLVMFDGRPVASSSMWASERRPELKRLFQHYVYGYLPPPPGIDARVVKTDDTLLGGKCRLREIEISLRGLPADAPKIHLALFLPREAKGPTPVFVALNKCGNQEVLDHAAIRETQSWRHQGCPPEELARGAAKNFWCVDYLIERGYGLATFHESDIDPDQHDFNDGIHPFYADLPVPDASRWGTIAAWAWGLHRAVDYLATDADVDSRRICLIGHSRRGKTALLAAALDERVALVVPHQSGTGGMALSRANDQETVERINRVFPHWFNGAFKTFNDREERLPVDQHLLAALVAPRALLDTAGLQDKWANYDASLRNLRAADRVWKFLDAGGIAGSGVIEPGQPVKAAGNVAQFRLDEKHTLNRDYWQGILDFADHVLPTAPGGQ